MAQACQFSCSKFYSLMDQGIFPNPVLGRLPGQGRLVPPGVRLFARCPVGCNGPVESSVASLGVTWREMWELTMKEGS
jgi:hypothetical protein